MRVQSGWRVSICSVHQTWAGLSWYGVVPRLVISSSTTRAVPSATPSVTVSSFRKTRPTSTENPRVTSSAACVSRASR